MLSDIFISIRTRKENKDKKLFRKVEVKARKELGKLRKVVGIPGLVKAKPTIVSSSRVLEHTKQRIREEIYGQCLLTNSSALVQMKYAHLTTTPFIIFGPTYFSQFVENDILFNDDGFLGFELELGKFIVSNDSLSSIPPPSLLLSDIPFKDDEEECKGTQAKHIRALNASFAHQTLVLNEIGTFNSASKHILLEKVEKDWKVIQHAPEEFALDEEILLSAVKQDDHALHYASCALCGDINFMLKAVAIRGGSLRYALKSLRNNHTLVMAAIQQNPQALEFSSQELRNNTCFIMNIVSRFGVQLYHPPRCHRHQRKSCNTLVCYEKPYLVDIREKLQLLVLKQSFSKHHWFNGSRNNFLEFFNDTSYSSFILVSHHKSKFVNEKDGTLNKFQHLAAFFFGKDHKNHYIMNSYNSYDSVFYSVTPSVLSLYSTNQLIAQRIICFQWFEHHLVVFDDIQPFQHSSQDYLGSTRPEVGNMLEVDYEIDYQEEVCKASFPLESSFHVMDSLILNTSALLPSIMKFLTHQPRPPMGLGALGLFITPSNIHSLYLKYHLNQFAEAMDLKVLVLLDETVNNEKEFMINFMQSDIVVITAVRLFNMLEDKLESEERTFHRVSFVILLDSDLIFQCCASGIEEEKLYWLFRQVRSDVQVCLSISSYHTKSFLQLFASGSHVLFSELISNLKKVTGCPFVETVVSNSMPHEHSFTDDDEDDDDCADMHNVRKRMAHLMPTKPSTLAYECIVHYIPTYRTQSKEDKEEELSLAFKSKDETTQPTTKNECLETARCHIIHDEESTDEDDDNDNQKVNNEEEDEQIILRLLQEHNDVEETYDECLAVVSDDSVIEEGGMDDQHGHFSSSVDQSQQFVQLFLDQISGDEEEKDDDNEKEEEEEESSIILDQLLGDEVGHDDDEKESSIILDQLVGDKEVSHDDDDDEEESSVISMKM